MNADDSLLTNFPLGDGSAERYMKAAKATGMSVYISAVAYDGRWNVLDGYAALHANQPYRNYSQFWKEYNRLKEKENA